MNLDNKVAVITGGVSGIGQATARMLAHEKVRAVAVVDHSDKTAAICEQMNQEIGQNLLKELDNLLLEIEGLTKQQKELRDEIARLMAEIKAREVPLKKEVPPVIVQFMPPPVTVPPPVPAPALTVSVLLTTAGGLNVAPTVRLVLIVTEHVPVPELEQTSLQPANEPPALGVAVSVTMVPVLIAS